MNRNLAGADITSFMTGKNILKCRDACLKHAECDAYTYHTRSGRCWIKRAGHNQLSHGHHLISAYKSCYTGQESMILNLSWLLDWLAITIIYKLEIKGKPRQNVAYQLKLTSLYSRRSVIRKRQHQTAITVLRGLSILHRLERQTKSSHWRKHWRPLRSKVRLHHLFSNITSW